MAAGTLVVRHRTLAECIKRRRVIAETEIVMRRRECAYRRYEREQL
jgi:hypothetical protein